MAMSSNALLPVVYWYGHPDTKRNPLLMDRLIRNLGENVNDRFELDQEGMFIKWFALFFWLTVLIREVIGRYCRHSVVIRFKLNVQ